MISDEFHSEIYDIALLKAVNTPAIGSKLAGNCSSISLEMLPILRNSYSNAQLVVGYVNIGGRDYFRLLNDDLKGCLNGEKREKYELHSWLTVGGEVIDLTLASTFKEINFELLPKDATYISSQIADSFGILYCQQLVGDDVFKRLHMMR